MSKILFLTTSHSYNDDRIFYHQAKELAKQGYEVKICSLSAEYKGSIDGIEIESYSIIDESIALKMKTLQEACQRFQPDCVICSEPLAVVAAKQIRKEKKISIIYDITEWYPSMRMVERYPFFLKFIHAIRFFLIQLYAGYLSTHFIFGEYTKRFPLAYVFPFKKRIILPYFPDDSYIHTNIRKLDPGKITLCYTGQMSEEKGIGNFFEAADRLRKKQPGLRVDILLIGSARKKKDEEYFSKLLAQYAWENIRIERPASFETFTHAYSDADICFDLRELNYENDHCLPIKIFYYAASGKPVIYTDLKATRKHVDVSEFGFLVDPKDPDSIAEIISAYIADPELYHTHACNAREEYEKKYNWNIIRNSFTDFVQQALRR
ncbi:glycosyltransferase involved in cell wall biosynthesis [Chryseobacterium defluvii]|uniref:Glycosyltransferase involved in cell wall biosynthesis n=1 Tax=Chryseobacterium defluvii TaxID=160396 RepID=A0A840KKF7_9FLAO|nr:glycosyltransferase [Chryseobacterium defluvii]MBB4807990.1 glycosyltransferase involved in cell wall biosynthesis [Chryseobacterium defluvii]